MRRRQIVRMVKEIWFPELKNRGFSDNKGEYIRRLDSGVVHLIGIGKDPHGAETFRVMCGVDAVQLKEECGSFGYTKYDGLLNLTPKGWDTSSGRWPCGTEEETRASLSTLRSLILDLAIPYFAPIITLSDVGDEFNETGMPHLGWMKARLYLLDGDIPRARAAIENYAAWAAKPRYWVTKSTQQEGIARSIRLREEIDAAESASDS